MRARALLVAAACASLAACTVRVDERRFFKPKPSGYTQINWNLRAEDGTRYTGQDAVNRIYDQFGIRATDGTLPGRAGGLQTRHLAQSEADRPLFVYCGGLSFLIDSHADSHAVISGLPGDMLYWNYPGYGRSEGEASITNLRAASETVAEAVEGFRRPGQEVYFWGHSLGGFVCSELAMRYPDTSGLVLEATAPTLREAARSVGSFFTRGWVRVGLKSSVEPFAIAERLDGAGFPVLVAGAREDRVLPVELSERLAAQLAAVDVEATFRSYSPARHDMVVAHDDFERDLAAFIGHTSKADAPSTLRSKVRAGKRPSTR